LLGGENLIAREEVERLQELRGTYGIKAPAPICADPSTALAVGPGGLLDDATCQVVEAPAGGGQRLVAGVPDVRARFPAVDDAPKPAARVDEGEIRLTYRELSALIEEAIRSLR
jgi:hypothetical protein